MSDMVDDYRAMDEHRKALRAKYGIECATCKRLRPKGNATIRLPQQRCRVCKTIDTRPELTDHEWQLV